MSNLESVKLLVQAKATVNLPLFATSGYTALYWVVACGELEIAKFLVSQGACTHPIGGARKDLHSPRVLIRLSDIAALRPDAMDATRSFIQWLRAVETPKIDECDRCGLDGSGESLKACDELGRKTMEEMQQKQGTCCANWWCEVKHTDFEESPSLRLKTLFSLLAGILLQVCHLHMDLLLILVQREVSERGLASTQKGLQEARTCESRKASKIFYKYC